MEQRENLPLLLAVCLLPLLMPFHPGIEASLLPSSAIAQTLDARKAEAEQLLARGVNELDADRLDAALQSFQKTLDINRQLGNHFGEAVALNNLGVAYYYQGQYEQAIASHQQSMKIFWNIIESSKGDSNAARSGIAASLNNQSIANLQLGQYQKAIELCHGAIAIFRNLGNASSSERSTSRIREAAALNNMGVAYENLREYERAIGYFQEALTTAQGNGDVRGEAIALSNIGEAYEKLGQPDRAKNFEQQALAVSQKIGKQERTGETASSNDYLLVRQKERSLALLFSN